MTSDTDDLRFTRVFDAPRELVFTCMTDPDHLTAFWGPAGMSTPRENITVDLRVGGAFETTMVNDADGSTYTSRAVYTEIAPPERLAWRDTASGVVFATTFADLGDGRTEVQIVQSGVPAAFRSPEAQAGFLSSLDKFAAHLASLAGVA